STDGDNLYSPGHAHYNQQQHPHPQQQHQQGYYQDYREQQSSGQGQQGHDQSQLRYIHDQQQQQQLQYQQQHHPPSTQQQEHEDDRSASASESAMGSSSTPWSENGSSMRFKVTLEAQTAAMQRQDETSVTYLNKGQFYTIGLEDTEEYDDEITSVVRVAFHDASHRHLAAR
ncbi:hypothetical protein BX616_008288, partial [Lobosporangium transversale]